MPGGAGRIDLDLGLNLGEFNRQLSGIAGQASNQVAKAFRGVGGIIAAAFAVNGLIDFGNQAIKLASDLQEVQNVVNVTFGSMKQEIDAWSKDMIDSFGLSELSAKKYASTMGAMLKSSGLAGAQMKDMSKNLTELSADMASFYNLSTDEAYYKVFAGMTGETEPLKALGVNMSVANMEAYALSQGIQKSYEKMSQAEQTLLRYNYLLSVTGDAQGDFARNGDSWANQIRIMTEQWKIFQGTMGIGFINILTPIVKGLNWLIAKLQIAAAYFKAFTEIVFGDAVGASAASAANAAEQASGSVAEMGDATAGAADKVKKAGKKVKGSLGSFDQLNTISQGAAKALDDAAGSAGDMFGGIGAGADFGAFEMPEPDIATDVFKAKMQEMLTVTKATWQGIWGYVQDYGRRLSAAYSGLGMAMQPIVAMKEPLKAAFLDAGKSAKRLVTDFLVPVSDYFMFDFIPTIVTGMAQNFAPVFANIGVSAMELFAKSMRNAVNTAVMLWDGTWLPALERIKKGFTGAMPTIAGAMQSLIDNTLKPAADFIINQFAIPIVAKLQETFVPIFADTLVWAVNEFAKTFDNAVTHMNKLWTTTLQPSIEQFRDTFLEIIPQIGDSFKSLLTETIQPFVDYLLNEFIIPISSEIQQTFVPIFTDILTAAFEEAALVFEQSVKLINDVYNTVLKPVFDLIKKIVMDTLGIVNTLWKEHGETTIKNIRGTLGTLRDLFMKLWDDILKPIIVPFLEMLSDVWDKHLKGLIEEVGRFIFKLVDAVTEIWNKFIWPILGYLLDKLKPAFKVAFDFIAGVVGTAIGVIADVVKGLLRTFGGAIDFITGVFTGDWKKAWNGLKDFMGGWGDALVGIFRGAVNLIIDLINGMIGVINNVKIDIPDWVSKIPGVPDGIGGEIGFKIPKIPKLAKGGLAYGPTLAMVGDNKGASVDPEVVSPLSKLQDMLGGNQQPVVAVLELILRAIQDSNARPAVLQVGEAELGRTAARAINAANRQAGGGLLQF
ncbi:hypothetical protein AB4Z45_08625 [Paenibacillus sp. MCAF9]|uniref:phage tail protein n=1 Tax=Paenibacillus sp. MCAF9 TaxID=3233046 RepID=UPI003F979668